MQTDIQLFDQLVEVVEVEDDEINQIIMKERNDDIKDLEKDLIDLHDSLQMLSLMVHDQGSNLNISANNVEKTVTVTNETVTILEQIPDKKEVIIKNVKIASGIIIGGTVLGGIGSIFGIIPALIGASIGGSTGGIVGYLTNIFK
ncbi:MAG: hypothetical protein Barrevirus9_13 [Barrevirus sp.]|uniref:t-SNARE coiled-coil homology domain-containing protein n=1 Tax=Barrevirus sp. TaxID=2487763 RepID=A0A3G4ZRU0_9VIRU|nr:MAG: hypothetical protein Barrevirus9_13 [Barrevirus sp.]